MNYFIRPIHQCPGHSTFYTCFSRTQAASMDAPVSYASLHKRTLREGETQRAKLIKVTMDANGPKIVSAILLWF